MTTGKVSRSNSLTWQQSRSSQTGPSRWSDHGPPSLVPCPASMPHTSSTRLKSLSLRLSSQSRTSGSSSKSYSRRVGIVESDKSGDARQRRPVSFVVGDVISQATQGEFRRKQLTAVIEQCRDGVEHAILPTGIGAGDSAAGAVAADQQVEFVRPAFRARGLAQWLSWRCVATPQFGVLGVSRRLLSALSRSDLLGGGGAVCTAMATRSV